MSGLKIETRSKLLIAALGLLVVAGCAPVGYYDQPVGYYGYGGGPAVVLNYDSYHGRPGYYGHPHHGYGRWR